MRPRLLSRISRASCRHSLQGRAAARASRPPLKTKTPRTGNSTETIATSRGRCFGKAIVMPQINGRPRNT